MWCVPLLNTKHRKFSFYLGTCCPCCDTDAAMGKGVVLLLLLVITTIAINAKKPSFLSHLTSLHSKKESLYVFFFFPFNYHSLGVLGGLNLW